jgi:hypothetical protein
MRVFPFVLAAVCFGVIAQGFVPRNLDVKADAISGESLASKVRIDPPLVIVRDTLAKPEPKPIELSPVYITVKPRKIETKPERNCYDYPLYNGSEETVHICE